MTFGAVAAASVDADLVVEDLFGTPRPRGDMRLTGVRAGAVELAAVELETEAVGPGRFAIALEASGPRMTFTARTMTEVADGVFLVTLEQLSGQLDGIDLCAGCAGGHPLRRRGPSASSAPRSPPAAAA
jgi:hypothetical protein